MRVIVCGSRKWDARKLVESMLFDLAMEFGTDITVVHGASGSVDNAAHQEAQKAGLDVEPHRWQDFVVPGEVNAKRAPLKRNEHMAALGADLCVAFWDGRSTGTAHMMTQARNRGIPVRVVRK